MITIVNSDAIAGMSGIKDNSIQCCVTSPPYWGLRNYGHKDQIGLEKTPEEYVAKLTGVFEHVRRVLKPDGTCWVNLGDSYARNGETDVNIRSTGKTGNTLKTLAMLPNRKQRAPLGLKDKDLVGIPWMVAFALRAAGWWLRSEIIWAKKNTMPESVTDRPTKSHEQIFLLTKSPKYYYDYESILEPCSESTHPRISQDLQNQIGSHRANGGGKTNGPMKTVATRKLASADSGVKQNESFETAVSMPVIMRNKRDVWHVGTQPYKGAHFATFPPNLIKPCVMAGTKPGDTVIDPFAGSGTTGKVAIELGRRAFLIELNPTYCQLIRDRCTTTIGLGI